MKGFSRKLKVLAVGIGLVVCFSACSRIAPAGNGAGYEGYVGSGNPDSNPPPTNSAFVPSGAIASCQGGGYTVEVTIDSLQIRAESGAVVTEPAKVTDTPSGFVAVASDATLQVTFSDTAPTGNLTLTTQGDGGRIPVTCQSAH